MPSVRPLPSPVVWLAFLALVCLTAFTTVSAQLPLLTSYNASLSGVPADWACSVQDAIYLPGGGANVPALVIAYNCPSSPTKSGLVSFVDPLTGAALSPPVQGTFGIALDTNPGNGFQAVDSHTCLLVGGLDEETFVWRLSYTGGADGVTFSVHVTLPYTAAPPSWKFSANPTFTLKDGSVLVLLKDSKFPASQFAVGRVAYDAVKDLMTVDVVAFLDTSFWSDMSGCSPLNVMAAWDPTGDQLILAADSMSQSLCPMLGYPLQQLPALKKHRSVDIPLLRRILSAKPPTLRQTVVVASPLGTKISYLPSFTKPGSGLGHQVVDQYTVALESVNFANGTVDFYTTIDIECPAGYALAHNYNQVVTTASGVAFIGYQLANRNDYLLEVHVFLGSVAVPATEMSALVVDPASQYLILVSQESTLVQVYDATSAASMKLSEQMI